jgi:hypothetical protein
MLAESTKKQIFNYHTINLFGLALKLYADSVNYL